MTKKKIIAIILFLFLSLFMFTFANPGDIKSELKEPEKAEEKPEEPKAEENKDAGEEKTNPVVNNNTNDNKENKKKLEAPVIEVTPDRVVILVGDNYDVMTGVSVKSEEKLEVKADITDTTKLEEGHTTVTYNVSDSEGNSATATRELVVLDPDKDEDGDGFTNGEELRNEDPTDPEDEKSHPDTVEPKIVLKENPYKLAINTEFVEPGYDLELDIHDTITTADDVVVDSSNLDITTLGTYKVVYSVVDRYGKEATSIRTVKVCEDENHNHIPDEDEAHYTVTATAGEHGSVDPESKVVIEGDSLTITISAETGYAVKTIEVDGTPLTDEERDLHKTGYTFEDIKKDSTLNVTFSEDENNNGTPDDEEFFTVIWKNEDGTVLETDENVQYGTMPTFDGETPTKEATAQYTYTFDEWTPTLSKVVNNAEYTATYTETVNEYTVTFYDEDGVTVVGTSTVEYGKSATAPTAPEKESTDEYTYTFDNWYTSLDETAEVDDLSNVVANRSVYAKYIATKNEYTVTFYDEDGVTVVGTSTVEYGESATAPTAPEKESTDEYTYTFDNWYTSLDEESQVDDLSNVVANRSVYAKYIATKNNYTLTFDAKENGTIDGSNTLSVPYGTTPAANEMSIPTVNANLTYRFTGWKNGDTTYTNDEVLSLQVTSDMTFEAQYETVKQVALEVTLFDANTQISYQVNTDVDMNEVREALVVKRVYEDGRKSDAISDYTIEGFSTKNGAGEFELTCVDENADGRFTGNAKYTITKGKAYKVKFTIELNETGSTMTCDEDGCDYDTNPGTLTIANPALELTETYNERIVVNSVTLEYTDGTANQTLYLSDDDCVRYDYCDGDGCYAPVYTTNKLNSTNIKYVTVNYQKRVETGIWYNPYKWENHSITFEYVNGEFVARSTTDNMGEEE